MKRELFAAVAGLALAGPVAALAQADWNHENHPAQQSRPAQQSTPRSEAPRTYSAPQQYAPPQNYGGQRFSEPRSYNAPRYSPPQNYGGQRYSEPRSYSAPRYSPPQNYGGQRFSEPRSYNAPRYAPPQTYGSQRFGEPRSYNVPRYTPPQTFSRPRTESPDTRFAPRQGFQSQRWNGTQPYAGARTFSPSGARQTAPAFANGRRETLTRPALRGVAANPAWRGLRGVSTGAPIVRESSGRIQGPGAYQNLGWNRGGFRSSTDYYNQERSWWGDHRDWWEDCEGFEDYDGPRFGFWFAPGWGYYQPSAYWYDYDWAIGVTVPYELRAYYVSDPFEYGLPYAPEGCEWIFLGDELVLIDLYTGEILEIAGGY